MTINQFKIASATFYKSGFECINSESKAAFGERKFLKLIEFEGYRGFMFECTNGLIVECYDFEGNVSFVRKTTIVDKRILIAQARQSCHKRCDISDWSELGLCGRSGCYKPSSN